MTTFGGRAVAATDVLIRYTYEGDANLDGLVNADDYFQIDAGYITQNKGWYNGDFNYDDVINADDYFRVDSAFVGQAAPLVAPVAVQAESASELGLLVPFPLQRKKDNQPQLLAGLFSTKPVL